MKERKYPEIVTATMQRIVDKENSRVFLVRRDTQIHFGDSKKIIGKAIMTNPGSYGFTRLPYWKNYSKDCNYTGDAIIKGSGYADLTIQKVIDVVRFGYKVAKDASPNGLVDVTNISAIVQPKGASAEKYHHLANNLLKEINQEMLLFDDSLSSKESLQKESKNVDFIILGFVKKAFQQEAENLMKFSQDIPNTVYAKDSQGWYSHPRRWQTEKILLN